MEINRYKCKLDTIGYTVGILQNKVQALVYKDRKRRGSFPTKAISSLCKWSRSFTNLVYM